MRPTRLPNPSWRTCRRSQGASATPPNRSPSTSPSGSTKARSASYANWPKARERWPTARRPIRLPGGRRLTLPAGSHTFFFTGTQSGPALIRLTLSDTNGQSLTVERSVTMTPLIIHIRPRFVYGTCPGTAERRTRANGQLPRFLSRYGPAAPARDRAEVRLLPDARKHDHPVDSEDQKSRSADLYAHAEPPSYSAQALYYSAESPLYYADASGNPTSVMRHGYQLRDYSRLVQDITNRPSDNSVSYILDGAVWSRVNK